MRLPKRKSLLKQEGGGNGCPNAPGCSLPRREVATRAADKSYEGHIASRAPLGAHRKFASYADAASWLAARKEESA